MGEYNDNVNDTHILKLLGKEVGKEDEDYCLIIEFWIRITFLSSSCTTMIDTMKC